MMRGGEGKAAVAASVNRTAQGHVQPSLEGTKTAVTFWSFAYLSASPIPKVCGFSCTWHSRTSESSGVESLEMEVGY